MNEWGVVGVLVVVAGLVVTIVGPIIKLNTAITTLTVTMRQFEKGVDDLTEQNAKSHDRIWKELECHDGELKNHEGRITRLEGNRGKEERHA